MSPRLSDLFLGSQSDERLVSLARAGHERAFVAIVERYNRQLLGCARRLGPEGHAEDIVQQAFLSAFAALQAGAEIEHLRGWLHQIVRHAAIKTAVRVPTEERLGEHVRSRERPEEEVEQRMLLRATLAEVAVLPERQRAALIGVALQGRSRTETAISMGLSDGAVRQLVHRARANLRAAVTAITPYPLAEWATAARGAPGGDRVAEIILGAGSASAGGLALKAGAVIVSGVVAAGIAASPHSGRPSHHQRRSHQPAALNSPNGPARAALASASMGDANLGADARPAQRAGRSTRSGSGSGDPSGRSGGAQGGRNQHRSSLSRGGSQHEASGTSTSDGNGSGGGETSSGSGTSRISGGSSGGEDGSSGGGAGSGETSSTSSETSGSDGSSPSGTSASDTGGSDSNSLSGSATATTFGETSTSGESGISTSSDGS